MGNEECNDALMFDIEKRCRYNDRVRRKDTVVRTVI